MHTAFSVNRTSSLDGEAVEKLYRPNLACPVEAQLKVHLHREEILGM